MRTIERTSQFRSDYKRVLRQQHGKKVGRLLEGVLELLVADEPLPPKLRDHAMVGNWADHRNCHLRPDLILLYRKRDADTLQLVRLGSHSDLGI